MNEDTMSQEDEEIIDSTNDYGSQDDTEEEDYKSKYEEALASANKYKGLLKDKDKKLKGVLYERTGTFDSSRIERLELKSDGYSQEQISAIMDLGGVSVLSKPSVKKMIDGMNTLSTPNPQGISRNSTMFSDYTQNDIDQMSYTEYKALLQKKGK